MRELVFEIEYEPGSNRVADTLAEYPDARIRSLSLHATTESLWRVDHVTGPPDALGDVEAAFLDTDYYTDCLTPGHCGATQRTQVLETTDEMLVLYSYWERTDSCASVPHMALERLGHGVLFEATKRQRRHTWRIVHSGEGDVRGFFDDLSSKQAQALQAAVEHGYYETPREIDVGGLADRLDVPRSTLNHRLRRAEEHLAKRRVARMTSQQRSPSSD